MAPPTRGATARAGKRGTKKGGRGTTGGLGGPKPALRKKSKLVITFDPDKRKEYLTGFHKRKQERRRFGLDMEAYKVKKRQLEAKKQRREENKEKLAALNLLDEEDKESEEEVESESEDSETEEKRAMLGGKAAVTKVFTFDDAATQGKFGDVVTVTTQVGDLQSDSEDDSASDVDSDDDEAKDANADAETTGSGKRPARGFKKKWEQEQHLTLFQRIQLQRKGKALPSKRSKLKEARASRKAMLGGKKNHGGGVGSGKKGGNGDDADGGGGGPSSKLNKKLKLKRGRAAGAKNGGANKRHKKR